MKKSRTADEKFILALAELSESDPVSKYEVGERAKLQPKAVNAITKELQRANFIKRVSDDEIVLTANGKRLVEALLEP